MNSSELKKEALSKFHGKFTKLVLIQLMYTLVTLAFSFVIELLAGKTNSSTILSFLLSFVYLLVTLPFSFGVLSSIINISKGEEVSITDFINIGLKKFGSYWKVTLRVALKLILPLLAFIVIIAIITGVIVAQSAPNVENLVANLMLMMLIVYILLVIFMLILLLPYVLTSFVLYDNPEKTSKEILQISSKLMKNNKLRYVGLMFSFFGWFLLAGIVTYIATAFLPDFANVILSYVPMLFLTPYITITQLSFYENLKAANFTEQVEEPIESDQENA